MEIGRCATTAHRAVARLFFPMEFNEFDEFDEFDEFRGTDEFGGRFTQFDRSSESYRVK